MRWSTISPAGSAIAVLLPVPGRDRKDTVCVGQIARGGRHDGALRDDKFASRLDGKTNILLAHEIERRGTGGAGRSASGRPATVGNRTRALWFETAGPEELVDSPGQHVGTDSGDGCGPGR